MAKFFNVLHKVAWTGLFISWIYGIFQVFGTEPGERCDPDMWNAVHKFLMYTFLVVPVAIVLHCAVACCMVGFIQSQAKGADAEIQRKRSARPAAAMI